jgi:hypothetical protein
MASQLNLKERTFNPPNAALILGKTVPSMQCPSDPAGGLQLHSRFKLGGCQGKYIAGSSTANSTDSSMGASYVPSGGPVMYADPTYCYGTQQENIYCQAGQNMGQKANSNGEKKNSSPGMFAVGNSVSYRIKDCTDGTSHVFLAGEQLPAITLHNMLFHTIFNLGSTNYPPNYHLTQGILNQENAFLVDATLDGREVAGFKSQHQGGLHMAMTDSSVHFVTDSIDYYVWALLGARADGQPLSLP